jgi:hypothetical protein
MTEIKTFNIFNRVYKCSICFREFRKRKEILEHVKEHKKLGEGGLFLINRNTRLQKIYLEIFKNPGITGYELKKKIGWYSGVERYLATLRKHKLIITEEERNGRILKKNFVNIKLLCNFVFRWLTREDDKRIKEVIIKNAELFFNSWKIQEKVSYKKGSWKTSKTGEHPEIKKFINFFNLYLEYLKEGGLNIQDVLISNSLESINFPLFPYIVILRILANYIAIKYDRKSREEFVLYLPNYKLVKKFSEIFGEELIILWKNEMKKRVSEVEKIHKFVGELDERIKMLKELLEGEKYEELDEEYKRFREFIDENSDIVELLKNV